MLKRWMKWTALLGLVVNLAGCNDNEYKIKQEHNMDRRGMQNNGNVDQNRVNTNLPQGGSEAEKSYRTSPNIRPSDANGGNPQPIEGQGAPGTPTSPGTIAPGAPAATSQPTPQPTRIGPSHPHH